MSAIRLITFDLDNTLWPTLEVIERAERECSAWLAERHAPHSQALSVEALRMVRTSLLQGDPDALSNLTSLRIRCVVQALMDQGVTEGEARGSAQEAFEVFISARNRVEPFEGAFDVLRRLKKKYILGALTNGNADLARIGISELFDFHHSSETVGKRKPAPDMFEAALRTAGVGAEESVHVGDHPVEDILAADRLGFLTVWVRTGPHAWPEELPPPRFCIADVKDLPHVIEQIEGASSHRKQLFE